MASSGGSGVLVSDKCASAGLEVVPFTEDTRERLDALLPSFGSSANPVDTTSQILVEPDLLLQPLTIVLNDPNIDMVTEFVDALVATRAYEANLGVMGVTKDLSNQSLRIIA